MYHFYKDDPWGNKVPLMSIARESVATDFIKKHKNVVTQVVNVPRDVQSLIEI